MPRLLESRTAFLKDLKDLRPDELSRYAAVLDGLISWSEARPARLMFRAEPGIRSTVSYCSVADGRVIWSAHTNKQRTAKGEGRAKLALLPGHVLAESAFLPLSIATDVLERLAASTGAAMTAEKKLDIPFLALKNARTRNVVKDVLLLLMDNIAR